MRPPSHSWRRRVGRGALAILLTAALLPLGALEAFYRYGLSQVGETPPTPMPRTDFATRALWAVEENGPPRLEPRWPWTLLADLVGLFPLRKGQRPRAGSWMSSHVAGRWLASRAGGEHEPHLRRSLRTVALSIWISRHWSAEELLASYADGVSFGPGLTGLDAAARAYFGKEAGQLALHEAALLAGVVRSPTRYHPLCRPENALRVRDFSLSRLHALGWISEAQREDAQRQPLLPLEVAARRGPCAAPDED